MEISFYQIDDVIHKSIASLLVKILENQKRVLIYDDNKDLLNKIDEGLWSFSKIKFLPHGTVWDNLGAARQPILLTNIFENPNNADCLIILKPLENSFQNQFTRVYYFFDKSAIDEARKAWLDYKKQGAILNFYRRENAVWQKINL